MSIFNIDIDFDGDKDLMDDLIMQEILEEEEQENQNNDDEE